MDIIFRYLPVERGLIILFDEDGNPVPKLTKFIDGAEQQRHPHLAHDPEDGGRSSRSR